jgi:hypothetical protein
MDNTSIDLFLYKINILKEIGNIVQSKKPPGNRAGPSGLRPLRHLTALHS